MALGFKQHASDQNCWLYSEPGYDRDFAVRLQFIYHDASESFDRVTCGVFLGTGASGLPYKNRPRTRRGLLQLLQGLGFNNAMLFDGVEPWDPVPGGLLPEIYFCRNPKLGHTEWHRGEEAGQPRRTTGIYRDLEYALPKVVR